MVVKDFMYFGERECLQGLSNNWGSFLYTYILYLFSINTLLKAGFTVTVKSPNIIQRGSIFYAVSTSNLSCRWYSKYTVQPLHSTTFPSMRKSLMPMTKADHHKAAWRENLRTKSFPKGLCVFIEPHIFEPDETVLVEWDIATQT